MKLLGRDTSSNADISLHNLKKLRDKGYYLFEVKIFGSPDKHNVRCEFIFFKGFSYEVSGFSVGPAGEGSCGLWKAICIFYPHLKYMNFHQVGIRELDHSKDWKWSIRQGFYLCGLSY